jgi:hypothetical protein
MRTLGEAPRAAIDPVTGAPAWGSYRGTLERVDIASLARDPVERLATEKKWLYGAIAHEQLLVAFAVVDLGYAASAFAFAYQDGRGLLVDRSYMGVPRLCRVRRKDDRRIDARFVHPRASIRAIARESDPEIEVHLGMPDLELRATLDGRGAPPAITAIAPIPRGHVSTTEKRALMPVRGSALVRGRQVPLDGGVGGYDFTHGLLARRTKWNWAFLLGRAATGEPIALNLVEGFVGEPECAAWIGGELFPLGEGRFAVDREAMGREWRVTTADGVDLVFTPGAIHQEHRDLGLVSSRFVQPIGTFSGTVRAGGRSLRIERALGVVEDQDVKW